MSVKENISFVKMRSLVNKIGFMDKHLYHELALKENQREILTSQLVLQEMELLMEEWMKHFGKNLY